MVTAHTTLKKVAILKVSLENEKIKKNRSHDKNTVKDKLSSHCYDPTKEPYFHLCDDMNNTKSVNIKYFTMIRYVRSKVVSFTAFNKKGSPSEHYFKRYLTLLHFDKAHCVRFENLSNLQK